VVAAAISASAWEDNDSISLIAKPPSSAYGTFSRQREKEIQKQMGKDLRPSPRGGDLTPPL
jgi:hypothetical protein